MQPPRRRTDVLGHSGRESDDIVLRGLLDRVDALDVESAPLADIAGRVLGNYALVGHRLGCGDLNLQPGFVLALIAPDATHLGVGVPVDHRLLDGSWSVLSSEIRVYVTPAPIARVKFSSRSRRREPSPPVHRR